MRTHIRQFSGDSRSCDSVRLNRGQTTRRGGVTFLMLLALIIWGGIMLFRAGLPAAQPEATPTVMSSQTAPVTPPAELPAPANPPEQPAPAVSPETTAAAVREPDEELSAPEIVSSPEETEEQSQETLPEWLTAADVLVTPKNLAEYLAAQKPLNTEFVVQSGRWSTREEAEAEALKMVRVLVEKSLQHQFGLTSVEPLSQTELPGEESWISARHTQVHSHTLIEGVDAEMHQTALHIQIRPEQTTDVAYHLRQHQLRERGLQAGMFLLTIIVLTGSAGAWLCRSPRQ